MIWLTADLHTSHENLLEYCKETRPFLNVEEMNATLIKNWNNKINSNDTVYVLGDLCMGKLDTIETILGQLKGHIILIRGNHDTKRRMPIYQEFDVEIKDIDYLEYKGKYFILSHFPIVSKEFAEMIFQNNSECWVLHGHTHQKTSFSELPQCYHVGVDSHNMMPISLEEIWQEIRNKE